MKAFLMAVVAAFGIAAGSAYVLDSFQRSSDVANTTIGARVDFSKDGIDAHRKH